MTWPMTTLGEVAEINPRLASSLQPQEEVAFVPMAELSSETASTSLGTPRPFADVSKGYTPFKNGDILVAKITPCFENMKIGQAILCRSFGAGSTEFHVIRPVEKRLDKRYLLHFLRRDEILRRGKLRMTGSGGQRRVPAQFLSALQIPLPPLDEQRRIAAILDQASAFRDRFAKREQLLDELKRTHFSRLFESATSQSWPRVTVLDVAKLEKNSIRTGPFGSQLLHSEFVDSGVAVLGIDNVTSNSFEWRDRRYITPEKYESLSRYTVHPGDVLVSIMGTCGRTAVVPGDIPKAINTKHLCCITLDQERCLPEFLHASLLWQTITTRFLTDSTSGAIMAGLNMGLIKQAPLILPPISAQRRVVDSLWAIQGVSDQFRRLNVANDKLIASLQSRAFRGEL